MLEDSAPSSACSQAAMSEEPARRWADFSGALKKTEPRSEPAGSGGVHVTRAGARPGREGTKGGLESWETAWSRTGQSHKARACERTSGWRKSGRAWAFILMFLSGGGGSNEPFCCLLLPCLHIEAIGRRRLNKVLLVLLRSGF